MDIDDMITDWAGYLPCGCLADQREHTCSPDDVDEDRGWEE